MQDSNKKFNLSDFFELKTMKDFWEAFEDQDSIKFAIAVSGGPDSMALAYLLNEMCKKYATENSKDIKVYAITIDHNLRAESDEEALQVAGWLSDFEYIDHFILKRPKDQISQTRIQEEARNDRMKLIERFCADKNIRDCFFAHHQDDQAETVLFRLAKGSGLDGLSGMNTLSCYSEALNLWRPLLSVPKSDLIDLCSEQDVPFVTDPSNSNLSYARVRLRQSSEALEREGLTAKRLSTLSNRLERASDALDFLTNQAYEKILRPDWALSAETEGAMSFSYDEFLAYPFEIRLRFLKGLMAAVASESFYGANGYGPRLEKLEDLVAALSDVQSFKDRTLGGCIIRFNANNRTIFIENQYEDAILLKNSSV